MCLFSVSELDEFMEEFTTCASFHALRLVDWVLALFAEPDSEADEEAKPKQD